MVYRLFIGCHLVGLFVIRFVTVSIVIFDTFDQIVRCLQPGIRYYDNFHTATVFDIINYFTLFVKQVSRAFNRNLRQDFASIVL